MAAFHKAGSHCPNEGIPGHRPRPCNSSRSGACPGPALTPSSSENGGAVAGGSCSFGSLALSFTRGGDSSGDGFDAQTGSAVETDATPSSAVSLRDVLRSCNATFSIGPPDLRKRKTGWDKAVPKWRQKQAVSADVSNRKV